MLNGDKDSVNGGELMRARERNQDFSVEIYEERLKSEVEGIIIDIETIGEFDKKYKGDSRECRNIIPVIFGYLTKNGLKIYYVEKKNEIPQMKKFLANYIPSLNRPFYAFNCEFESSVLYHSCDLNLDFDHELNSEKYEPKRNAVRRLGIGNYGDPFDGDGKKCKEAWLRGDAIDKCIEHNRACLLKERDILLKRGFRKPDDIQFVQTRDSNLSGDVFL